MSNILEQSPICALATASGVGAIAVIRVSGLGAISLVNAIFRGRNLEKVESHTVHFGVIFDQDKDIDEVLVVVFKSPKSFTKEDTIEISCHGSPYIIQQILRLLVVNGCTLAKAGEFTQRAFLNGQFDLVQAEAVADLIAADAPSNHEAALNQLRGGFSKILAALREELIHFASLVELELDFGEEDVEFAQRDDLKALIHKIQSSILPLIESFNFGNVVKDGVPVAIVGPPNVGKSTLLNALLNEEKAIVTPIAGTTRDVIEDVLVIGGIKFRMVDTAGIRETTDVVEAMGIERSKQALAQAKIAILLFDNDESELALKEIVKDIEADKTLIWVKNKADILPIVSQNALQISAKLGLGVEALKQEILANVQSPTSTVVTNIRHYEHLIKTNEALSDVLNGIDYGITGDFLAQDIRLALHHLGEITGTIATDDLLANIFGKFCIGK